MLETCFLPHVYHFLKGIFFCDAVHNSRVRISFILLLFAMVSSLIHLLFCLFIQMKMAGPSGTVTLRSLGGAAWLPHHIVLSNFAMSRFLVVGNAGSPSHFVLSIICDGKFIDSFATLLVYSNEDGRTIWAVTSWSLGGAAWLPRLIVLSNFAMSRFLVVGNTGSPSRFVLSIICDGKFIDSFATLFVYSNEDGRTILSH